MFTHSPVRTFFTALSAVSWSRNGTHRGAGPSSATWKTAAPPGRTCRTSAAIARSANGGGMCCSTMLE